MTDYELMLVLRSDYGVDESQKVSDVAIKLIGEESKVGNVTPLGKKKLAYPINKKTEGVYYLLNIATSTLKIGDVEKRASQNEDVIRYLIVRK